MRRGQTFGSFSYGEEESLSCRGGREMLHLEKLSLS
jgi:hypothetical protein